MLCPFVPEMRDRENDRENMSCFREYLSAGTHVTSLAVIQRNTFMELSSPLLLSATQAAETKPGLPFKGGPRFSENRSLRTFQKGQHCKRFRLCGLCVLCLSYSGLPW